jgi:predicted nucleotidyltransferase
MSPRPKIESIVADYCASRPEVVACYLFGSQALGRTHPGSDVDLGFLIDGSLPLRERFELRLTYCADLGNLLRQEVDAVLLDEVGEVLLGQIFGKGEVVYGWDSEALRLFRRHKLPMIAEFSYYINLRLATFRARYTGELNG